MEKIKCTIERITFQNAENGYSVLQATIKGYRDEQTLVGTFHEVTVGAVLTVEGSWRVDKRYGRQFAVESWTEELPATVIGIEKYLGSGLVKGIGPKFAKQIVSHFGLETFEVIENDIDRLLEVPNIGKGRVAKIKESWEKQKDVKDNNPYCLADDIWGIGFKTADGIAEKLGYEKNDSRRCRSGILYTLSKLSEDGHVYSEREQLVKSAKELLQADEEPITQALDDMIAKEDLMLDEDAIFLPPFYYAEVGVANKLRRLIETPMQESHRLEGDGTDGRTRHWKDYHDIRHHRLV